MFAKLFGKKEKESNSKKSPGKQEVLENPKTETTIQKPVETKKEEIKPNIETKKEEVNKEEQVKNQIAKKEVNDKNVVYKNEEFTPTPIEMKEQNFEVSKKPKIEEQTEMTPITELIEEEEIFGENDYIIEENGEEEFIQGNDSFGFKDVVQKEKDFEAMDVNKLVEKQQNEVINISQTLDLPVSIAGALLRAYRWKKEKLLLEFFDDKEKVCKIAQIDLKSISENLIVGEDKKLYECSCCYDDRLGKDMRSLICKHFMCINCWKNYLEVNIKSGPNCLSLTCPAPKCKVLINESIVNATVDKEYKLKYQLFLSRSFVDDNPNILWCPAPNCGKVVFCPNLKISSVECNCGFSFCPSCKNEAHHPCDCSQIKHWRQKNADDSETANYICANTKECPKCKRNIEKNGGCNHMTCGLCRYEFCWICMGDWSKHGQETGGFYQCNKYKPEQDKKIKDSQSDARQALEKYMHYYTRFANHEQSQQFESKLRKLAEEKMKELQQKNKYSSWLDVQFIEKAVEQLIECRSALKYTYAYAYYLEEGPQKTLFEYLQEELEKNTELLSGILEGNTNYDREKIINLTKIAGTRLEHLLKGASSGFEQSE